MSQEQSAATYPVGSSGVVNVGESGDATAWASNTGNRYNSDYQIRYESSRSFDIEDDMEFYPGYLSDEYRMGLTDSSTSSSTPHTSPMQQQHQQNPQQAGINGYMPYYGQMWMPQNVSGQSFPMMSNSKGTTYDSTSSPGRMRGKN
ncbi:hypothetical protein CANCADRAFT_3893 [Tortispora caseinolytica NRRL Y-17796]|uniref:Uncharacterized protein n=1 Tax=Tortispora caseinolytica NRRL Y-17796 TaxID=767744 RepID=A0A1E4TBX9_9ASCO|nr:hypothetical protein CANCADRAFT_3893 [Tortispora caseinolytica NRRL Y-17796]